MPSTSGPKTLILDLYGAYGRELGNWFAVADLVTLLGEMGLDDQAVRSAVSRMTRRGLLVKDPRDDVSGYRLSEETLEVMTLGDRRIYATSEPTDLADGWVLASFSVPEAERQKRYLLRSRLEWLGFGNNGRGLWLAPRRTLDELEDMVRRLDLTGYVDVFVGHHHGFGDVEELIQEAWDWDALAGLYVDFLDTATPMVAAWTDQDPADDPRQAFVDYTWVLHEWRKVPFQDPGLPPALLPDDWVGPTATTTFLQLHGKLQPAALDHVRATVTS